ncbi:uncharacterized protein METZ01_LOCUS131770, partial [marine metagenome]
MQKPNRLDDPPLLLTCRGVGQATEERLP